MAPIAHLPGLLPAVGLALLLCAPALARPAVAPEADAMSATSGTSGDPDIFQTIGGVSFTNFTQTLNAPYVNTAAYGECVPGCVSWYTVVSGDYCAKIASDQGIFLNAFLGYNACLKPSNFCNVLQPGQQVCVRVASTCPSTDYPYIIKSGDTCNGIANSYGISEPDFEAQNPGILCGFLQVNQVVCGYTPGGCCNGAGR